MSEIFIDREFGRRAFGDHPAGYHAARPAYPDWVFDRLRDRCGFGPATATFEVGAGTGIATRRLLEMGADPLVAIEPDARMAGFLREALPAPALRVINSSFEEAQLPAAGFSFGISATAFHWVEEQAGLEKVASLLSPGGWWAMVWHVFGDMDRADAFHEATKTLLKGYTNITIREPTPFALDTVARLSALEQSGAFDVIECEHRLWEWVLDADAVVALYATYSNIQVRPDRDAVLTELGRIAREQFNGAVTRNMVTSLYLARRRADA
jgi:SAM-dependent methyltransferase